MRRTRKRIGGRGIPKLEKEKSTLEGEYQKLGITKFTLEKVINSVVGADLQSFYLDLFITLVTQ